MKRRSASLIKIVCSLLLLASNAYMYAMSAIGDPYWDVAKQLRQLRVQHEEGINSEIDIVGAIRKDFDGNILEEAYGSLSWLLIVEYCRYGSHGPTYHLSELENGRYTHDSSTAKLFRRIKKRYEAQYDAKK